MPAWNKPVVSGVWGAAMTAKSLQASSSGSLSIPVDGLDAVRRPDAFGKPVHATHRHPKSQRRRAMSHPIAPMPMIPKVEWGR